MPKKRVKLAIVGSGSIFLKHLEGIIKNVENFEIIAIATHGQELDYNFPKQWEVKTFYDHNEMFDDLGKETDYVVILTQSLYHTEITKETINRGYNVLVEKPIAEESSVVKEIDTLAQKNKVKANIVLQCRYMSLFTVLQKILDKELLGDIRCIDFQQKWQRPVGYMDEKKALKPLYEYSIHYLDIIQNLFGIPEVKCTNMYKHKHLKSKYHDTVRSLFQYKENISGSLFFTLAAEPSNLGTQLSIIGSEGFLNVDFGENKIEGKFLEESSRKTFNSLKKEVGEDDLFTQLYRSLSKGEAPTVKSAILVTEFIENIYSKEDK